MIMRKRRTNAMMIS
uniref:Uncharacterized protein n=1 Tax=Rhizophora mucronata TaxID=61149 RepID=A0A2P2N5V0_RHIMU